MQSWLSVGAEVTNNDMPVKKLQVSKLYETKMEEQPSITEENLTHDEYEEEYEDDDDYYNEEYEFKVTSMSGRSGRGVKMKYVTVSPSKLNLDTIASSNKAM